MSASSSIAAFKTFLNSRTRLIADAAIWAAVRVPSPVYVAMLSRMPAAVVATSSLAIFAFVLLLAPSGLIGVVGAMLCWSCSMVLAASAVRLTLLQRRMDMVETELRTKEAELNGILSREEASLLKRTQALPRRVV